MAIRPGPPRRDGPDQSSSPAPRRSSRRSPHISDILEDWVRLPVSPADRKARVTVLEERASPALPLVGGDGGLHFRGASARLSENQVSLVRMLIEGFGAVASREAMVASVWPDRDATAGNLRVMVARLRPVLVPLGLEIRAVRSRGYR